jgi:hypothetical protein
MTTQITAIPIRFTLFLLYSRILFFMGAHRRDAATGLSALIVFGFPGRGNQKLFRFYPLRVGSMKPPSQNPALTQNLTVLG